MDELERLQDRLASALGRIEAAVSGVSGLAEENAGLKQRLEQLQARRDADRQELDDLVAQIRPLLEGENNA